MVQIAAALQALHRKFIIRRCLSPENILIRKGDGVVFLTDLELSKVHDGSPTVKDHVQENPYQALEVSTGDDLDVTADLYSWGRIFVHAGCGTLPSRNNEKPIVARIACSDEIKRVVERCVAMVHTDRPKSMDDVLAVFQRVK